MPVLFSLPNELLVQVFMASPTPQIAIRLSRVNKLLRMVWLQQTDQIVECILKSTIPAAEEAIALAITETQLRTPLSSDERPPLRLWLPNLMRNADLCDSALAACDAYTDPPNSVRKTPMKFPSSPASYYFRRRVSLAFEYPQLRDAVHAELRAASMNTLDEHFMLHYFLMRFASKEEVIRQGVPLHVRFRGSPEPPEPGEDDIDMHQDAWSYLDDVICSARCDCMRGTNDLPAAIQGYIT